MDSTRLAGPQMLFHPQTWTNPYPVYRELRAASPVVIEEPTDANGNGGSRSWMLLQHDQVYGALRDHETFSSHQIYSDPNPGPSDAVPRLVLIQDDPPRHTNFRRLVNKVFTPRRVAELEPWIRGVAAEQLDEMGAGQAEVVSSYTVPLPVKAIARLLGIPGAEYQTFKRWSDAFLAFNDLMPEVSIGYMRDMTGYFGRMAAERRAHGAEDLITALVQAEVEGQSLQEWEVIGFCTLLLIAGNETTTNLMGNMLNLLAGRPDLWGRLRADRALVEPFIEETLRYESPVQILFRRSTRDVELGGSVIPRGASVLVGFGAANRDPAAFAEPDEVRLDRDLRSHVAFGMGIHYCLGAPLARLEAKTSLNLFLDRFESIAPGDKPGVRQQSTPIVFGFRELPLRLGA